MNVKWVSHHHWPINPLQNRAPMPTNQGNEPPPYQGSVDKRGMTALLREPGNEFPGSVNQSRLKPTVNALSESPSGDFSSTQPGSSFPGVGPARASARKSPVPQGEGRGRSNYRDGPTFPGPSLVRAGTVLRVRSRFVMGLRRLRTFTYITL